MDSETLKTSMNSVHGSHQAPNVSKYRSTRLPTGTRHPPSYQEPNPAVAKGNDFVARSRSRYHRKNAPKTHASTPPPRVPSDSQGIKQRHLATLAALTGEPFVSNNSDDENAAHMSQKLQPYQGLLHDSYTNADREWHQPYQNASPSNRCTPLEAQAERAKGARVGQNVLRTGALESSLSPQVENSVTQATQREDQSSQHDQAKNTCGIQTPNQARAGTVRVKSLQTRDQIPKDQSVGRKMQHAEGKHGRTGQKQNAPMGVIATAGQGPLFPGTDAPVSAINAGERKVFVKYNDSSMSLPVTPSTTPSDLIVSAAKVLGTDMKAESHQVVEFFHQLALERPLRTYENVRDVMNSWESDTDNHLYIVDKAAERGVNSFDIVRPPDEQPEASMSLYHSSKPGRWDKRWTILKGDGQISISKKEGESLEGLCHLSDFDLYTPTRQKKKKIKSPKKICFAIKSQQKSSIFLSGQNFIHFFATNDRDLAAKFHQAVWGWRSWFLIHVLGKSQAGSSYIPRKFSQARRASISSPPPPKLPHDPNHDELSKHATSATSSTEARSTSNAARKSGWTTPPTSFPKHFVDEMDEEPTAASLPSLPNIAPRRSNSNRQIARPNRSTIPRSRSNSMTSETEVFKATGQSTRKSPSKREKPKPLVDLTPVFQEPPQHSRKGRGVAAEPGKQLVDQIADPEPESGAAMIPSSTAWRRSGEVGPIIGSSSSPPQRQATRHARGRQSIDERRPLDLRERPRKISSDDDPFTGGLISKHAHQKHTLPQVGNASQSEFRVMGRPLIDLSENFQSANGGLKGRVGGRSAEVYGRQ